MKKILSLFLILSLIFSSNNSFSQALREVSFNTRVNQSQVIVEGKVVSKKSFWDANHYNIYTANKIEVYKVFKGNLTASIIEIITPGGTVGLQRDIVEPSLSLSYNETGIFMLKNNTINYILSSVNIPQYEPYASVQGFIKYDLIENRASSVFDSYNNIDNILYNSIQNLTNASYTIIQSFSVIPKGNITNKLAPSISGFSPGTVSAGTKTQLTINGSGFGATQGTSTVEFADANNGGSGFFTALVTQTVSWSATQIIVEVPDRAGTGTFRVVNGSAGNSPSSLTISFAELNVESDALSAGTFVAYQPQHIDEDGNGGYTWQMFTDFDANASANASFVRALDSWRCTGTNVNWSIGSVTTTDVVASDGINIVRDDNGGELPGGVLGRCTSRYSGCFEASTIHWFVTELDIAFDDAANWNYGPAAPGFSEFDFETVAVHELGHGHQLGHVISPGAIMHFSVSNGTQNRTPGVNDLAGGNDVMSRSTSQVFCGNGLMTNFSCGLAPVADFSGNPLSLCEGNTVSFTDLSTNTPTSWSWTFTGGTPSSSTAQNPTITYNTAGTYQVILTATNASGSDGETKLGFITVTGAPNSAGSITGSSSQCENTTGVTYSIAAVSGATGYVWAVPPGASVVTGQNTTSITVNFGTTSGNVSVTPNNSCGNGGTANKAITINVCASAPAADFSGNPLTLCEGNTVSFTDLSTNTPTSWNWTFTGGIPASSTSQNPTITYNTAGTYQVVLTATNASGSDGETKVGYITVNGTPSAAGAITGSSSQCENATGIAYSIAAVSGATGYVWTVPPGASVVTGQNTTSITVNYGTTSGNVSVTPNNSCGNGGTVNKTITISTCASAPVADFIGNPTNLCEGNTVSFTDLSTNTPTSWSWTFTGGTPASSTAQNPTITYNTAGTYQVILTASNASGSDPETKVSYITVSAPTGAIVDNTKIRVQDCGKTLNTTKDVVYADIVVNANYYQFKVTNTSLGFSFETPWMYTARWIRLMDIPGIQIGTTYDIQVRARIGRCDVGTYGTTCQVTTPGTAVPPTQITAKQCGTTFFSMQDVMYADPVLGATSYIFEIANAGLGFSQTVTGWAGGRGIRFYDVLGIQISTTYDIRIKVIVGGVTGNYGSMCQITTPSVFRLASPSENNPLVDIDISEKNLNLKIYPNPSQGEFVYLELQGLSINSEIIVTDIYGKTVLNQPVESNYESYNGTLRFNTKLKAGFYMITIVSGDQKTTEKLIVR